ncbi:hypothetical protein ASD90_02490 [Terrabacter sp. Root181]|nr:hypothetical protein ASD90_02490 [Terrabacter sp. Root181]
MGGEVGAELVEGAGVPGPAPATGVRVEAVQDRGDRGGVGGDGETAHPVLREAAEDPAPGPGVRVPLLAAAGVDRRDRPPQPRGERPLRHGLPVAGRGEHGLGDGGHVRIGQLGGLGCDLQRTVQRGRPGAQRAQDDPVPTRRGRQGQAAGDLAGADPGREGDLLGHDSVRADPRGHPGDGAGGEGVDLLGLDGAQRAVGGEQVGLEARLGDLERLDLGQHPLTRTREPLQGRRRLRPPAVGRRHGIDSTPSPSPMRWPRRGLDRRCHR